MPAKGSYLSRPRVELDEDGSLITLLEDFVYIDPQEVKWTVPKGAKSDGASIPRSLWTLMGAPLTGKYRNASIVHDFYCGKRNAPWRKVHRMFYDAMLTSGVGATVAKFMYGGVYGWGPRWTHMDIHNTGLESPIIVFKSAPVRIINGLKMRRNPMMARVSNTTKAGVKYHSVPKPKTKPKQYKRPKLDESAVKYMQHNLRTHGRDLDNIEMQIEMMLAVKKERHH